MVFGDISAHNDLRLFTVTLVEKMQGRCGISHTDALVVWSLVGTMLGPGKSPRFFVPLNAVNLMTQKWKFVCEQNGSWNNDANLPTVNASGIENTPNGSANITGIITIDVGFKCAALVDLLNNGQ